MTTMTMGKPLRVAMGEKISEMADTDPRLVVLDGDTAVSTRTDIFQENHPERFYQTGIAEMNMLGMAAGMATVGDLIPIVSTFSAFIASRAHDSIRVLIAQPSLNVKLMSGYSGLLAGMTGKTHLLFDDIPIMRAMANMVVVCPVDEVETKSALEAIIEYDGPVYFRLNRGNTPIIFDDDHKFELGKAVNVRAGSDVTVFATGVHTARALEAAELVAADGIDVNLVHVPTVKPLDVETIVAEAEKTGRVLTTEEGTIIGGLGGAITETLGEFAPMRVKRHGLQDVFGESGPDGALLEKYGINAAHVASAIRDFVKA